MSDLRPIEQHPCHGLFVSAGDRLTHRHWFQDNKLMPTCERCGTQINRDHQETGPVSWEPERRREVITVSDRYAISQAAMRALGEWLAWPDAGRDGAREVTVAQTLSFLKGLPNKLGYARPTPSPTLDEAAIVERCARVADRHGAHYRKEAADWLTDMPSLAPLADNQADAGERIAAAIRREGVTTVGEGQAETYRQMHDIAVNDLGYPSILEALEATPHAATPTPNAAADALALVLLAVRDDLHNENRLNTLSIADTIWHALGETTVDFIDAHLAQYRQQQPGTSHLNDEGKA